MTTKLRTHMTAALLALAAGVAAQPARAQDKPVFFHGSILVDETQKFSDAVGIPFSFLREIKDIEKEAPFLAKGAIAGDKPLGFVGVVEKVNGGRNIERLVSENLVFVIPMNKDFGTTQIVAKTLTANGAQVTVDGDTVRTDGVVFRRTGDYLMWSTNDAVIGAPENPFKNDYKTPGTLLSATLDLAVIRKSAPKLLEALWNDIARQARSPNVGEQATVDLMLTSAREIIDPINTVNFTVTHDETALRATLVAEPLSIKPEIAAVPRPTFGAPQLLEIHLLYPNAKMAGYTAGLLEKLDFTKFARNGKPTDEEYLGKIKASMLRIVKLLSSADAISVGITVKDDVPTVLAVNQYGKEVDFSKELHEIVADADKLIKEDNTRAGLQISEYAVGDQKVTRVIAIDHDKPELYFDFAQSGKKVAMSFSTVAAQGAAAKLLTAPANGQITDFISATVDLGEAAEYVVGMFPLPGALVKKITDSVAGKTVSLTVKSDPAGTATIVEANVPISVLKDIGGIIGPMMKRFEPDEAPPAPAPEMK